MIECNRETAIRHPITIKQGSTHVEPFVVVGSDGVPVDITGYTFYADIKRKASSATIVASWSYSITDAENGRVALSLTHTQTAAIDCGDKPTDPASQYVCDFFGVSPSGERTHLADCPITVKPRVTVIP